MLNAPRALLGAVLMFSFAAGAQQMDPAMIKKWNKVKMAHFKVRGEFDGWAQVAGGTFGQHQQGQLKDSFELEFDWSVLKNAPTGPVTFRNGKTTVGALRDAQNCTTPQLKGDVEHFEIQEVKSELMGQLQLYGTRSYPDAMTAQQCPAGKKLMPAKATTLKGQLFVDVPDPTKMVYAGMPTGNKNVWFSQDKQSIVMRNGQGWTFTFTPTPK